MKRVLWSIVALSVIAGLLGLLGVILIVAFGITIISVGMARWERLPEPARQLAGAVIVLSVVLLFWFARAIPDRYNPGSVATSRIPGASTVFGGEPGEYAGSGRPAPPDEVGELRERFRHAVFELRRQEGAVRRALDLDSEAARAIAPSEQSNLAIRDLIAAKSALGTIVKSIPTGEDLNRRIDALEAFLKTEEVQAQQLKTVEALNGFWDDFRLRSRQVSFSDLNDQVLRLENELKQLQRQVVDKHLHIAVSSEATLIEERNELVRDVLIGLTWTDLAVARIDASELLLDRDPKALKQELLVSYGEPSDAVPPNNPAQITIRQSAHALNIVRRTVTPADLARVPTRLRLPPFPHFFLSWPTPFAVKLRTTLDLSPLKGQNDYPFVHDLDLDARIKNVRLPADAYYASSYTFKPSRREGDQEVLEGNEDLKPTYFVNSGRIWIELMPRTLLYRNSKMQEYKSYLIPENLVIGLLVIVLGASWTWIAAPKINS